MEQWEHKVVSAHRDFGNAKKALEDFDKQAKGWQLVSVCPTQVTMDAKEQDWILMFFRRPKP